MKNKLDPELSQYFSELARKRKNPYYGFKDPELARRAGEKGRAVRARKRKKDVSATEQSSK